MGAERGVSTGGTETRQEEREAAAPRGGADGRGSSGTSRDCREAGGAGESERGTTARAGEAGRRGQGFSTRRHTPFRESSGDASRAPTAGRGAEGGAGATGSDSAGAGGRERQRKPKQATGRAGNGAGPREGAAERAAAERPPRQAPQARGRRRGGAAEHTATATTGGSATLARAAEGDQATARAQTLILHGRRRCKRRRPEGRRGRRPRANCSERQTEASAGDPAGGHDAGRGGLDD